MQRRRSRHLGWQARTSGKGYLLETTPQVLHALERNLNGCHPNAENIGSNGPPFHAPTQEQFTARDAGIPESGATMVWVGLGTPKQDHEVARLGALHPVAALAVGAAFDFLAGTTRQAPPWMQQGGLEWAYRFSQKAKRLARRDVWGNSMFLIEASRNLRGSGEHG